MGTKEQSAEAAKVNAKPESLHGEHLGLVLQLEAALALSEGHTGQFASLRSGLSVILYSLRKADRERDRLRALCDELESACFRALPYLRALSEHLVESLEGHDPELYEGEVIEMIEAARKKHKELGAAS